MIGALTDCDTKGRLREVRWHWYRMHLEGIDIPIIANVRAGSIKDPITIPLHGKLKAQEDGFGSVPQSEWITVYRS